MTQDQHRRRILGLLTTVLMTFALLGVAAPTAQAATGQITGYGGKCVDVAAASTANGTQVQLYTCNGTAAQRWNTGSGSTIRALGKCLDVAASGTANGTRVQLWDCNGTAAQSWTAHPDGTLRALGKCLDATGPSSADGTPLQLWDCYASANQQWTLPTTGGPGPDPRTPVEQAGTLQVCGLRLCGEDGQPVQLRGMSTHGLQWYRQCVTSSSLDALANDWEADVVRLSMYIQEGGYETNPRFYTDLVHGLIDEVHARGMYTIVDWHQLSPGDPNDNTERAKTFFAEIAQAHGSKGTVLYEIANEPNGVTWGQIKSYAEEVIPVIRAADPDGVVLVGTPGWSSLGVSQGNGPGEIVNNPVNASNIMYTFHFYAASHYNLYYNALNTASTQIPIFVTEFGAEEASGDGSVDFTNANRYLSLLDQRQISWVKWNFSDDFRTGAAFTPGTCANGGPWSGSSLKPTGVWARDHIRAGAL